MNQGDPEPLDLDNTKITEISTTEFNIHTINSISTLYKKYRQDSKAP